MLPSLKFKQLIALTLSGCISAGASAGVIFSDDFSDGNADGWSFFRTDASEWGVLGGELNSSTGTDDSHDGTPVGYALIDGIVTPDSFVFEADISVVNYPGQTDRGHVGFIWGVANPSSNSTVFNTTYLRTHSNHVTNWDTTAAGGYSGGEQIYGVGNVFNGIDYHLKLEVDFSNQILKSTFTNGGLDYVQTLTGASFDSVSQWQGGSIGVVGWGEEVSYDNVVLTDLTAVPAPASIALFGLGLMLFGVARKSSLNALIVERV